MVAYDKDFQFARDNPRNGRCGHDVHPKSNRVQEETLPAHILSQRAMIVLAGMLDRPLRLLMVMPECRLCAPGRAKEWRL